MIWILLFISTGANGAAIKANFSDIPLQGFFQACFTTAIW